jgi:hypothetical protein
MPVVSDGLIVRSPSSILNNGLIVHYSILFLVSDPSSPVPYGQRVYIVSIANNE